MSKKTTIVISEGRNADPARRKLQEDLAARLAAQAELEMIVIPHLVDLAANGPAVERLRSSCGELIVLGWLYPRAAYWILRANGVNGVEGVNGVDGSPGSQSLPIEQQPDQQRTIWCLDLREHDTSATCLEQIARITGRAMEIRPADSGRPDRVAEITRPRWYPVIDYNRCVNCLECLNFCLFGVFDLDDSESIVVEEPDACRAGCPACSRVCPQRAIMFPQHLSPVIAGDPAASPEGPDLDVSELFGGPKPAETPNTGCKNKQGDLDRLVDELDSSDL